MTQQFQSRVYTQEKYMHLCTIRNVKSYVHSSIIHNSPQMKSEMSSDTNYLNNCGIFRQNTHKNVLARDTLNNKDQFHRNNV